MRVKNATFIQKHIEKLVLLVAAIFLVLVLAIFVGGVFNPYKVELGNKTYDRPDEVIPALLQDVERVEAGLIREDQIDPDYAPPDMQQNYEEMLGMRVILSENGTLPRRLSLNGTPLSDLNIQPPPPPTYIVPSPPMPAAVAMLHDHAVLDIEFAPELNPEFVRLWDGMRRPPDFYYVILDGEFSMYDWAQALIGERGQSGKVPSGIWEKRLNITGVYLIRERLDEQTGQWVDREIIPKIPGQIRVMPQDVMPDDMAQAELLIEQAAEQALQQEICEPVPPALANNDFIMLPKDAIFEEEQLDEPGLGGPNFLEGDLGRPMDENERRRMERRQQMEERRAERERQRGNRGGGDPGFEGGGELLNERDLERQRQLEERRQRQIEEELRRQAELEQQRQRQLDERRRRLEERQLNNQGGVNNEFVLALPGGRQLNAEELTRVFAMDVTPEYGQTYRYKLAVAVINPLYGVPKLAEEQFEQNKNQAALGPSVEVIEEADWMGPVTVPPKFEFFFVGGGESRSRLEVWTIFNGLRIKQEFEVSAGDRIGGMVERDVPGMGLVQVDLNVGATVVDIERRLDISNRPIYALTFIDEQGQLHERLQDQDKKNPRRRELDLLQQEQEQEMLDFQQFEDEFNDGPGRPR
ncbi:MAG: hypothetical protein AAGC44_01290 [Planctomycetota bacterium]